MTDEDNGTMTVRNKKTGETLTINLKDAAKGKFVFEQNGKKAEINAQGGGDKGSLEIKSSEGTVKFGTDGKTPDWLPSYPGSTQKGVFSSQTPKGLAGSYGFTTNDSIDQVGKRPPGCAEEGGPHGQHELRAAERSDRDEYRVWRRHRDQAQGGGYGHTVARCDRSECHVLGGELRRPALLRQLRRFIFQAAIEDHFERGSFRQDEVGAAGYEHRSETRGSTGCSTDARSHARVTGGCAGDRSHTGSGSGSL